MKAITIKQPWATLIAIGAKQFETRSWKTKYRGPIAIHAGKTIDWDAVQDDYISRALGSDRLDFTKDNLPTGSVIAIADLVDCHQVLRSGYPYHNIAETSDLMISGSEIRYGDYSVGRYAWELDALLKLDTPIPAKGKLSLWEWEGA